MGAPAGSPPEAQVDGYDVVLAQKFADLRAHARSCSRCSSLMDEASSALEYIRKHAERVAEVSRHGR